MYCTGSDASYQWLKITFFLANFYHKRRAADEMSFHWAVNHVDPEKRIPWNKDKRREKEEPDKVVKDS